MMMLSKLKKYYQDYGILSTQFKCPYRKICKGNNKNFFGPKSSFISSGYEKGKLPRLLFLSLDPGSSEKNPIKRLPEAVRSTEEKCNINLLHRNLHWYKTHELAYIILKQFKDDLTLDNVKHYFAHTNSVKCSMNNPNHKQARKILFDNCRTYILNELLILNPDIIVTQGLEAKKAIEKLVLKESITNNEFYCIINLNNTKVFWFHTFHPSNYGAFYKQYQNGEGWNKYSKIIYKWYLSKNA